MRSSLVLFFCLLLPVTDLSAQGLEFRHLIYDLGRIPAKGGCQFGHKFTFRNLSDHPFSVQEVKASCGCTALSWTRRKIAPGDSGFVVVSLNPKDMNGPVTKSISVSSDASAKGVEVLFLKAFVVLDSLCTDKAPVVKNEEAMPRPKAEEEVAVPIPQPFKHTFSYGHSSIELNDPRLLNWLEKVQLLAQVNGQVEVVIESSASHVPTGSRYSNLELAKDRAVNTQKLVAQLLKDRGVLPAQILFDEPEVLVQGPEFEDDAEENRAKYEEWQYVKIKVN